MVLAGDVYFRFNGLSLVRFDIEILIPLSPSLTATAGGLESQGTIPGIGRNPWLSHLGAAEVLLGSFVVI
jgi:hypothetical protein